jgi:hypothetical protein
MRLSAQELVWRLLHLAGVDDASVVKAVTAKAVESGDDLEAFSRWCKSPESPISGYPGTLYALLGWTVWSTKFAERDEATRNEDGPRQAFPFLWIDCYGCKAHTGSFLDGFCAHRDDPIWKELTAPFDWSCGCGIRPLLPGDPEVGPESNRPAADRLDRKLVEFILDWPNRRPDIL